MNNSANHVSRLVLLMFFGNLTAAVHQSETGTGQAAIIPFYSVANDLNTLVSVSNSQNTAKAVKVTFREGRSNAAIFTLNLYLDPFDSWQFALISGFEENTLGLFLADNSCVISPVEAAFSFIEIHMDGAWEWQNGSIDVIEMGNLNTAEGSHFADDTLANQCEALHAAWNSPQNDGIWQLDPLTDMEPAAGGIHVNAALIDVFKGWAFDIPPLLMDGFFAASTRIHTEPDDSQPDLDSGTHESLLIHGGQVWHTTWPTGYEAVSALLMKTTLENEYDVTAAIAGINEWVISFPTLSYHRANTESSTPFWFEEDNGFRFPGTPSDDYKFFDRDGQISGGIWGCIPTLPPDVYCPPLGVLSHAVNTYVVHPWGDEMPHSILSGPADEQVRSLNLWGSGISPAEFITGQATLYIKRPQNAAIGVYDHYRPNTRGVDANSDSPVSYHGLPVTGFGVQVFQNMNAQPGLLATYASARAHQGARLITTEE